MLGRAWVGLCGITRHVPWALQVDGQRLPLPPSSSRSPLPYFMSPVCGAACVIDMLTVNVIGGAGRKMRGQGGGTGAGTQTPAVSAFDGCALLCAEVVKPSHCGPLYVLLPFLFFSPSPFPLYAQWRRHMSPPNV